MNLSDFSLLKEDSNNYTIGHPKGKSITVPKQGLSTKAQSLISKLKRHQNFDGGTPQGTGDDTISVSTNTDSPTFQAPVPQNNSQFNAGNMSIADLMPQATIALPQSDGIPQSSDDDTISFKQPDQQDQSDRSVANVSTPPMPQAQNTGATSLGNAAPTGMMNPNDVMAQLQQQQKDISANKADIQNEWNNYKAKTDQLPSMMDTFNKYQAKDEDLKKAILDHKIDPNRLYKNLGTGNKIGLAIASVIGGIGAGLTHGPNLAAEMIQKSIDNDIEAQRNDQSQAMNLWKMNRENYGSEAAANAATRNQLLAPVQAKIQEASALNNSADSQTRLSQLALQFQQQQRLNQAALAINQGHPGTEQEFQQNMQVLKQLNPQLAQEIDKKYVPGMIVSDIPLAEKQRDELLGYKDFSSRLNDALDFAQNKAGIWSNLPANALSAKAKNLTDSLIVSGNNLTGLNRLNGHEYGNYNEQVGNVGSLFNTSEIAKLQDLQQQVQQHQRNLQMMYGGKTFKTSPIDAVAIDHARRNPQAPGSSEILSRNNVGQ